MNEDHEVFRLRMTGKNALNDDKAPKVVAFVVLNPSFEGFLPAHPDEIKQSLPAHFLFDRSAFVRMNPIKEVMVERKRLLDGFDLFAFEKIVIHDSGLEVDFKDRLIILANVGNETFKFPVGDNHRFAAA